MMMVAAAKEQFSLIGVNLWQTGIRSLFRYYQWRGGLTQDQAWANIRTEMQPSVSRWTKPAEEWEWQLMRAIVVEEHNVTIEEAKHFYNRTPGTPVIDALRACLKALDE